MQLVIRLVRGTARLVVDKEGACVVVECKTVDLALEIHRTIVGFERRHEGHLGVEVRVARERRRLSASEPARERAL